VPATDPRPSPIRVRLGRRDAVTKIFEAALAVSALAIVG
jgi:hypothetical protein